MKSELCWLITCNSNENEIDGFVKFVVAEFEKLDIPVTVECMESVLAENAVDVQFTAAVNIPPISNLQGIEACSDISGRIFDVLQKLRKKWKWRYLRGNPAAVQLRAIQYIRQTEGKRLHSLEGVRQTYIGMAQENAVVLPMDNWKDRGIYSLWFRMNGNCLIVVDVASNLKMGNIFSYTINEEFD